MTITARPRTSDDKRSRQDRRSAQLPVLVDRRVRELDRRRETDHSVAVGAVSGRPGWTRARCSCGAEVSARVEGVVECWAMWHLDDAARAGALVRSA